MTCTIHPCSSVIIKMTLQKFREGEISCQLFKQPRNDAAINRIQKEIILQRIPNRSTQYQHMKQPLQHHCGHQECQPSDKKWSPGQFQFPIQIQKQSNRNCRTQYHHQNNDSDRHSRNTIFHIVLPQLIFFIIC